MSAGKHAYLAAIAKAVRAMFDAGAELHEIAQGLHISVDLVEVIPKDGISKAAQAKQVPIFEMFVAPNSGRGALILRFEISEVSLETMETISRKMAQMIAAHLPV